MFHFYVHLQSFGVYKARIANGTFVRIVVGVRQHVNFEVVFGFAQFRADSARNPFLFNVHDGYVLV